MKRTVHALIAILLSVVALPAAAKVEFPWGGNDAPPAVNGITLGDPEQKALDQLGVPEDIITTKDGDEVLEYGAKGLEVTASASKVVAIRLKAPEAGSIDGIKVGDIARAVILNWGLPSGGEGAVARFGTLKWTISVRTAEKEATIIELSLGLNRATLPSEKALTNVWQVH